MRRVDLFKRGFFPLIPELFICNLQDLKPQNKSLHTSITPSKLNHNHRYELEQ